MLFGLRQRNRSTTAIEQNKLEPILASALFLPDG